MLEFGSNLVRRHRLVYNVRMEPSKRVYGNSYNNNNNNNKTEHAVSFMSNRRRAVDGILTKRKSVFVKNLNI